jgi:hypothetical protein
MGSLIQNKNNKKGQQDFYRFKRLQSLGDDLVFPDVSNTRFSMFLYAAAAVIVNLPFYQHFLKLVHNAKVTPGWTNLKKNCSVALEDIATLTELCAAAIYLIVVEKTYVARVRGGKPGPESPEGRQEDDGQPRWKQARMSRLGICPDTSSGNSGHVQHLVPIRRTSSNLPASL